MAQISISPNGSEFALIGDVCTFDFSNLKINLLIKNDVTSARYIETKIYMPSKRLPKNMVAIVPIINIGFGAVDRAYTSSNDISRFESPISFEVEG